MRKLTLFMVPMALLACGAPTVYAAFHATNGRISFTRFVPETNGNEIFSIRADGSDEQQLTFDPPGRKE